MTIWKNILRAALPFAMLIAAGAAQTVQAQTGVGYSPGANFDQLSWAAFVSVVQPAPAPCPQGTVMFETWATDAQTFTPNPVWPSCGAPGVAAVAGVVAGRQGSRFQPSLLNRAHMPTGLRTTAEALPVPCNPPGNAAAGNFPASPPTTNCVAEEVVRNKLSYDYITQKNVSPFTTGLNTQSALAVAYTQTAPIAFPSGALEVKIDWVSVPVLIAWLGANGVTVTQDFVKKNYFMTSDGSGNQYAMTSMHISQKLQQLPNWLWATFEHQMNPGRCDTMGCYDQFGAVAPNTSVPSAAAANTQYPKCTPSPQLATLFQNANLAAVWQNYCLKATQIDFVSPAGQPFVPAGQPVLDGDSMIERITADVPIAASSCITCHYYASFNQDGSVCASTPGLATNPIGNATPLSGKKTYDFVWGVIAYFNSKC